MQSEVEEYSATNNSACNTHIIACSQEGRPLKITTYVTLFIFLAITGATLIAPAKAFYCPDVKEIQTILKSPGELRVLDSYNRITGLVNGKSTAQIPVSQYINNVVTLSLPTDAYRYQVIGTEEGTYGLEITATMKTGSITFTAVDIPIQPNTTHQYTVNWTALDEGKTGETFQIDSNSDGTFETNLTTGLTLTQNELMQVETIRKTDINADGIVNIQDITLVALAYGTTPTQPRWNEEADMDDNKTINILDVTIIARNFGQTV